MVTIQSIIARKQENINRRKRLKQGRINVDNNVENVYYDVLGHEGLYYYISINRNDITTTDVSRIGDKFSCSEGFFLVADIIEMEFGLELKIVQVNPEEFAHIVQEFAQILQVNPEVIAQGINIDLLKDQIEEANEDALEKQMLIQDIYL